MIKIELDVNRRETKVYFAPKCPDWQIGPGSRMMAMQSFAYNSTQADPRQVAKVDSKQQVSLGPPTGAARGPCCRRLTLPERRLNRSNAFKSVRPRNSVCAKPICVGRCPASPV